MLRYLGWLANSLLFVLCCFLVANAANAVFASLLAPAPADVAAATPPAAPVGRTWSDRQVILTRNLFNASLLAPPAPVVEEPEDLEASRLPVDLLGTATNTDPALSWAAIADRETRQTIVVGVNGSIKNGKGIVTRIERKRIVLSENGVSRELVIDEDKNTAPTKKSRVSRRTARRAVRPRPEPAARKPSVGPSGIRNPAALFSQARILPKYEDGEMIGVQVNAIKDGSLFQQIGIEDGEVITEFNGIRIDSPDESSKLLMEFVDAETFTVIVEGPNGTRTLNHTVQQ